jgi:PST family polysaccharide transporter
LIAVTGVKRQFARSSAWYLFGQGTSNLASFIIFAVLARLLGPADFGLVAFAAIFVELTRSLAMAGLPTALIRQKSWNEEAASTAFWGNLGFSAILALLLSGGSIFFDDGSYQNFPLVISCLSATLIVDAMRATQEAKLEREFGFRMLAIRTALATIGAGILGVALAFAGFGIWALVSSRIANSVFQTLLVWRAVPWVPKFAFNRRLFGEMLGFGIHIGAAQLFGQVARRVPALVGGLFIGPAAVAFFQVAFRIVGIIGEVIVAPMQRTAIAALSRLADSEAQVYAYRRVTRLVSLLAFPAYFGTAVLSKDLILLMFGESWLPSGQVLGVLALFGGAASVSYFTHPLLAVLGKAKTASLRSLSSLIGMSLVCLIAAQFGIVALASAFTLFAYVSIVPTLFILKSVAGISPMQVLKDIVPSFFAATFMCLVLYLVQIFALPDSTSLMRVIILVPLGVGVYGVLVFFMFPRFVRDVWIDIEPLVRPVIKRARS